MQKVSLVVVTVTKSLVEKINRVVPEYEIPLLEAVHGQVEINHEETEKIEGQFKTVDSAEHEYNDFARIYGDDAKTGMPLVERMYRTLDDFIDAFNSCLVDGVEEAPKRKATPKRKTSVKEEIDEV